MTISPPPQHRPFTKDLHCLFVWVDFYFYLLVGWFFCFWDRVSLCSSDWPRTHAVDQMASESWDPLACPWVLELQACVSMFGFSRVSCRPIKSVLLKSPISLSMFYLILECEVLKVYNHYFVHFFLLFSFCFKNFEILLYMTMLFMFTTVILDGLTSYSDLPPLMSFCLQV